MIIAFIIVLVLLVLWYWWRSSETMFDRCGADIAAIKRSLKRQENLICQCKPTCHEQNVRQTALLAELKAAESKLEQIEEELQICKSKMASVDAVSTGASAGASAGVVSAGIESFIPSHTGFKYVDLQRANCVGSICDEKVSRHDINPLLMRIDHQAHLIEELRYELIDRNARINQLRREINYATGMY